MTLALALIVFLTITIAIFAFGAAVAIPFSALGARLRALGWQKQAELGSSSVFKRCWTLSARRFPCLLRRPPKHASC
ncbi:MAG: hypothetical protein DMG70_19335 [Acidobacteria bacterium]|nr:MAG: hypothetical protein DMG70_19335 [Acidobacteriota bacterium]